MPEISRFYGIIVYMYFNEHNPPHFHIEYQGFKAKIEIKTGILEEKMPKTAIKLTLKWLEDHKSELLENWDRIEQKLPLRTPLITHFGISTQVFFPATRNQKRSLAIAK